MKLNKKFNIGPHQIYVEMPCYLNWVLDDGGAGHVGPSVASRASRRRSSWGQERLTVLNSCRSCLMTVPIGWLKLLLLMLLLLLLLLLRTISKTV
jgi:hypothetical protein